MLLILFIDTDPGLYCVQASANTLSHSLQLHLNCFNSDVANYG